jgi:hypothetical protein
MVLVCTVSNFPGSTRSIGQPHSGSLPHWGVAQEVNHNTGIRRTGYLVIQLAVHVSSQGNNTSHCVDFELLI